MCLSYTYMYTYTIIHTYIRIIYILRIVIAFCHKIVATQWFPELLSSSSRILPSSEFLVVTITKLDQLDWLWWCQWHWQMFWGFEIHVCLYQLCVWKWCHLEAKFPIKASQQICKMTLSEKKKFLDLFFGWTPGWWGLT